MPRKIVKKFELVRTNEYFLEDNGTVRPLRVEIFKEDSEESTFRVRIWDQRMYNLYPTAANLGPEGGLENRIFSCDNLDQDVSNLVLMDPELLFGKHFRNEDDVLTTIEPLLENYKAMLSEDGT